MHVTHLSPHVSHHTKSLYYLCLPPTYPATVAVPDVHGAGTRVHIPAHGGFEAHNGSPNSILSHEPKPLRKHKPPPLQSVLSLDELSYPP
ncbi:hypothetical protein Tco_0849657 [Tanacetum coccineum]